MSKSNFEGQSLSQLMHIYSDISGNISIEQEILVRSDAPIVDNPALERARVVYLEIKKKLKL